LSVLGGFAIPFLYSIIVGPLTPYFKDNATLDLLAMLPVRWPILFLYRLGAVPFDSETGILIYLVGCNVALYTLLTYSLLWGFAKRKSNSIAKPPNPQPFVQQ
jgi:hypothetical protein